MDCFVLSFFWICFWNFREFLKFLNFLEFGDGAFSFGIRGFFWFFSLFWSLLDFFGHFLIFLNFWNWEMVC